MEDVMDLYDCRIPLVDDNRELLKMIEEILEKGEATEYTLCCVPCTGAADVRTCTARYGNFGYHAA